MTNKQQLHHDFFLVFSAIVSYIFIYKVRRYCNCFFPLSLGHLRSVSSPNYAMQINALSTYILKV